MCIYICITLNDHVPRYLILILQKIIFRDVDVDASYSIGNTSYLGQIRKENRVRQRSVVIIITRSMWLDKILRHCSDDVVLYK